MTRPQVERRAHRRFKLHCPTIVKDKAGREIARTRTADISDGGALLQPNGHALEPGQAVRLDLRLPRQTPNTFMYEDFSSAARVVRCQAGAGGSGTGVALAFLRPQKLEL